MHSAMPIAQVDLLLGSNTSKPPPVTALTVENMMAHEQAVSGVPAPLWPSAQSPPLPPTPTAQSGLSPASPLQSALSPAASPSGQVWSPRSPASLVDTEVASLENDESDACSTASHQPSTPRKRKFTILPAIGSRRRRSTKVACSVVGDGSSDGRSSVVGSVCSRRSNRSRFLSDIIERGPVVPPLLPNTPAAADQDEPKLRAPEKPESAPFKMAPAAPLDGDGHSSDSRECTTYNTTEEGEWDKHVGRDLQAVSTSWVLRPDVRWRQLWNALWLALCLVESVYTLTFFAWEFGTWGTNPIPGDYLVFYAACTAFYAVDMALQVEGARAASRDRCVLCDNAVPVAHTAYIYKGTVVDDDAWIVRRHYLTTCFPLDFLCTFPLALCLLPFGAFWAHMAAWVRVLRVLRIKRLFVWSNPLQPMPRHMVLIITAFKVLYMTNLLVFGSLLAFRTTPEEAESPLSKPTGMFHAYCMAVYFVIGCLTTVCFGDVYPKALQTRMFTLLVMMASTYLNLYILTAGLAPALRENKVKEKLEEKKHRLGTILEFYKVPAHIQKQVYAIYPYLLEATLSNTQEIAELPAYLQDQVYRHIKIDLLAQVPVFSGATRRAMAMLASTMTRILAPPMEYLTHEGEVSSCMFFLVQGVVQVLCKDAAGNEHLQCTLKDGSYFGNISHTREVMQTNSVRALTVCCLFCLDRRGFARVVRRHPDLAIVLQRASMDQRAQMRRGRRASVASGDPATDNPPLCPRRGTICGEASLAAHALAAEQARQAVGQRPTGLRKWTAMYRDFVHRLRPTEVASPLRTLMRRSRPSEERPLPCTATWLQP